MNCHSYTPSSMKVGELSYRIFSFIKTGHRDKAMSQYERWRSIATLRFKILTKIKGKRHGLKFGFVHCYCLFF